ncbi:MAG: hypothetical protein ACPGOY_02865 [Rhodospirillaceae bacterium]
MSRTVTTPPSSTTPVSNTHTDRQGSIRADVLGARDPRQRMETRLRTGLYRGVRLGDGSGSDRLAKVRLSEWMTIVGDIPDADILCELPVVLHALARDKELNALMVRDGLLPEVGSVALHFQAIGARIASRKRAAVRDPQDQLVVATLPARAERDRSDVARLRVEILKLADAAMAVEKERERLATRLKALEDRHDQLRGAVRKGVRMAINRKGSALEALASIAVSAGMTDAAATLRALPPAANTAAANTDKESVDKATKKAKPKSEAAKASRSLESKVVPHPAIAALRAASSNRRKDLEETATTVPAKRRSRLRLGLSKPGLGLLGDRQTTTTPQGSANGLTPETSPPTQN